MCPTGSSTPNGRPTVVVIGGGFGGLSAVTALRRAPVDVVLIDRANHHLFQPMLYQLATGIVSDGEIAPPLRGVFASQRNVQTRLAEIDSIDLERQRVHGTAPDGEKLGVSYDFLIVAAGAHPAYFGNDGWAEHAPGLKTLEDAHRLRTRILGAFEMAADADNDEERRRWLTFVTVGGGPTGVEVTGQIAELARHLLKGEFQTIDAARAQINLIDAGDSLLKMFPERLRRIAQRDLERAGVEVRLQRKVTGIDADGVSMAGEDGREERIPAGTVIWAAGVHGSPLAEQLTGGDESLAGHGGRVRVNEHCGLPGHPEVFVIGDLAEIDGVPGVAQPAIQEGRHAAKVINARLQGRSQPKPFTYSDKGSLAAIGHGKAIADAYGVELSGRPALLLWGGVHLTYLVGWGNRFSTAMRWAWTLATRRRRELSIVSTEAITTSVSSTPS